MERIEIAFFMIEVLENDGPAVFPPVIGDGEKEFKGIGRLQFRIPRPESRDHGFLDDIRKR